MQRDCALHIASRECLTSFSVEYKKVTKDCLSVLNRLQRRSFGTAIWVSHEFERTRGKVTANMEQNVSRHHTEHVGLDVRSNHMVHSS
ncbi:hypothetical protein TNCV_2545661 [Trichonephila clavipes]|nr:hypothetical protein TNCV_2545661 [Trichonephila clavipes]